MLFWLTQTGSLHERMETWVSGKSYAQLLKLIEDLIARGTKVSDPNAATRSAEILDWTSRVEYCLSLLEDKIPTALSDFRRIRQGFEFKVDEEGDDSSSASAYRPAGSDVLLDFSFEHLGQANSILKLAATKLEIEGHSVPDDPSDKELGEDLHAARLRAGHSQRDAAEQIGYDHKDVGEWERGKRKPHPNAAKNIRDYIRQHPKPNQP